MKRFYLQRNKDISGVSGQGKIAEGCQFDNGWCALVWLTGDENIDDVHAYYRSIDRVMKIHGHQGATRLVWIDGEANNFVVVCPTCKGLKKVPKPFKGMPFPTGWNHHSLPAERLSMWPDWHEDCPACTK